WGRFGTSTIFCCKPALKSIRKLYVVDTKTSLFPLNPLVTYITQTVFFGAFVIELREYVEEEIGVARDDYDDRKFVVSGREFERAAIDLYQLSERRNAVRAITFSIDDLAVVKGNIAEM